MTSYDERLKLVIRHLIDHWMDPLVGIVACGIFDPAHCPVIATSERVEEGKWLHAERNALQQFQSNYGNPGPETIVVVTLSPCIIPMLTSRAGSSCTELLRNCGLILVHAGVIDPVHVRGGIPEYKEHGIHLTTPDDEYCKTICNGLLNIFQVYGDRVNRDLLVVKKEIKYNIFEPARSS
jgi:pyrimidine deaminase RibD-like protein